MNPLNWKAKKGNSIELPCVPEQYEEVPDAAPAAAVVEQSANTPLQTPLNRPKEMESRRRAFSDFALYGEVQKENLPAMTFTCSCSYAPPRDKPTFRINPTIRFIYYTLNRQINKIL
jgi:hypothetical protein